MFQQQVANRFQMRPAEVGTALSRKAESIHVHNIVDILRHRKAAGYIDVVVVSVQEKIIAKVEILWLAIPFGNRARIPCQSSPCSCHGEISVTSKPGIAIKNGVVR